MKNYIIHKLGGFVTLEEAVEANSHDALTKVVAKYFNTITEEDVLRVNEHGQYTLEGKPLMDAQVQSLRAYATDFRKSMLFKVLDRDIKYQLNKKTFVQSAKETDLIAGKLGYWLWKVIREKLEKL